MADWTLFQQVGVPLAALLAVAAAIRLVRRRGGPVTATFWLLLWASAAAAIASPDVTTRVARALGVARGADLVLYCAVLAGFTGFWAMTVQQRRTQRDLTLLTRALAIQGARAADPPRGSNPAAASSSAASSSVAPQPAAGHGADGRDLGGAA